MKRKCDYCKREYEADMRNVKRGWGLCCSKSCAAKKREKANGHRFRRMQEEGREDEHPFSMDGSDWSGAR